MSQTRQLSETDRAADPVQEAGRRRTFAVISHPDAGKSTLTEALALHAKVISEAGAVHGKAGRRGVVSDWLSMERSRGISITSAALQFEYHEHVINLLDTPGHADFSEDTYRVLSAVDCAVMLLDSAKGLEPQTVKLFDVCRHRGIPVITFVNKWDRPGREALELCDELRDRIGLRPMPLTWPVGIAGEFRGVLDRRDGEFVGFERTSGGATIAPEHHMSADEAAGRVGDEWQRATEESELLTESGDDMDPDAFARAEASPVLFGSAVQNFGVRHLLDVLLEHAPAPSARPDERGTPRQLDKPFSAFVFKVQTGMDPAHRDRVAFARVCSGEFERGLVATHAGTQRSFSTKYAQQMFGQQRDTVERAYPGDVIGLVNASALGVGDTLYTGKPAVRFPGMPQFTPEHFAVARTTDPGRSKQFRRGLEQLVQEGVIQLLHSETRGEGSPVLAAVGPMQFDVVTQRMESEFRSPMKLEQLPYTVVRLVGDPAQRAMLHTHSSEVLDRADGTTLAVFTDDISMRSLQRLKPELDLRHVVADTE